MTPAAPRVLPVLLRESLADAVRRRLVLAIAVVSLLSLQLVDTCMSSGAASVTRNGETIALPDIAGMAALAVAVTCALWTMVLAGILASDHLAEPLQDGSAVLVLARPVGRGRFVLARLAGALAIALVAGALLLAATAFLLQSRHALAWWPVLPAFAACALGSLTVAAFAMAASLWLPRIATVLLVLFVVGAVGAVNSAGLFGAELGGLAGALDRYGPPLASSVAVALESWVEPTAVPGDGLALALRLGVWSAVSIAALVQAFRSVEIRS